MNEDNTPLESTGSQNTDESKTRAEQPRTSDASSSAEAGAGTIIPPLPETPAPEAARTGHAVPQAFTSPSPSYGQQAIFTPPFGGGAYGAGTSAPGAFGQTAPTQPLGGGTETLAPVTTLAPSRSEKKKGLGAGKVAALIVAAALVGGGAGFGTGVLGSSLTSRTSTSAASSPSTVTVNNPGSVNETTAIATTVLPSVVTIEVTGESESGSGSGVVLSDDGYVLTNTHVVTLGGAAANATIRVTTSDGHIYDASVVGTDPIYDLAVVKLDGAKDLTPIEFADSSKLNVGDTAVAVGAPLGLSNSVTTGIVSALNRSIEIASSAVPDSASQDTDGGDSSSEESSPFQFDIPGLGEQETTSSDTISIAVIQTDAAINPGNSGGALVDSTGKLIGINVAIATAGSSSSSSDESGSIGVGFSIPSNIAERVANEIIDDGAATHGLLGASVRDASSVEGASVTGAYIVETSDGGAAGAAGITEGDVITEFNGVPITSANDLTAQVRAVAAGSTATLTYVRDGSTSEADVTLGELSL